MQKRGSVTAFPFGLSSGDCNLDIIIFFEKFGLSENNTYLCLPK